MTRDVLLSILRETEGLAQEGKAWNAGVDHRLTFYLGNDGRGMVIQDVRSIEPRDTYLMLRAREAGQLFVAYDAVLAFAIKPPKEPGASKAGFA